MIYATVYRLHTVWISKKLQYQTDPFKEPTAFLYFTRIKQNTHKKYKWQGTQAYVLIFTTLQKKFISRKHCKILHKYGSFMALKNMTDKQMELAYPGLQRNAYSPTTKLLHARHKL